MIDSCHGCVHSTYSTKSRIVTNGSASCRYRGRSVPVLPAKLSPNHDARVPSTPISGKPIESTFNWQSDWVGKPRHLFARGTRVKSSPIPRFTRGIATLRVTSTGIFLNLQPWPWLNISTTFIRLIISDVLDEGNSKRVCGVKLHPGVGGWTP